MAWTSRVFGHLLLLYYYIIVCGNVSMNVGMNNNAHNMRVRGIYLKVWDVVAITIIDIELWNRAIYGTAIVNIILCMGITM